MVTDNDSRVEFSISYKQPPRSSHHLSYHRRTAGPEGPQQSMAEPFAPYAPPFFMPVSRLEFDGTNTKAFLRDFEVAFIGTHFQMLVTPWRNGIHAG